MGSSLSARVARWGMVGSMLLVGGCQGEGGDTVAPLHLTRVVIDSGADQTGVEGQALPVPVSAHVLQSDGTDDRAHVIYCRVVSGNGSIATGRSSATGNGATLAGPGNGTVSVVWTLGPASEQQALRIYVSGSDSLSATVTAMDQPAG